MIVHQCEQYYSILPDYQFTGKNHNALHEGANRCEPSSSSAQSKEIAMSALINTDAMPDNCADKSAAPQATTCVDPNSGPVHLRRGQYVRMHAALGWTVRTLSGTVWITQDNDLRDIMLQAGEAFALDRNGAALLWPLEESEICIERRIGCDEHCSSAQERPLRAVLAANCYAVRASLA
jgi:hypothetical protein